MGHVEGDKLLHRLAAQIMALLTENDRVFRIGGDEFVMLLAPGIEAEAFAFAHEVLAVARHVAPPQPEHCGE